MRNEKPRLNSPEFWEEKGRRYAARNDMRDRIFEFTEAAKHCIGPVLEVGSAFGGFTQYLSEDMQYVGIDFSRYMVARARLRFPRRIFLVANGAKFGPAWHGAFQTVAAFQFLEHFEKPTEVVTMLRKVAQRRLIFSVPRGQPTHSAHFHDGHLTGWDGQDDFRQEFQRFGELIFLPGNDGHICGTIEFGGQ